MGVSCTSLYFWLFNCMVIMDNIVSSLKLLSRPQKVVHQILPHLPHLIHLLHPHPHRILSQTLSINLKSSSSHQQSWYPYLLDEIPKLECNDFFSIYRLNCFFFEHNYCYNMLSYFYYSTLKPVLLCGHNACMTVIQAIILYICPIAYLQ
jgi:hypothetical protein